MFRASIWVYMGAVQFHDDRKILGGMVGRGV